MVSIQRWGVIAAAGWLCAVGVAEARAGHVPQCGGSDAYLDDYQGLDIGESTTYQNCPNPVVIPPLGPVASGLTGPVSTGVVTGQFEIDCSFVAGVCTDVQTWVNETDFRWAVVDADNLSFVGGNLGQTFFPAGLPNEGFVSVSLHPDNPSSALIRFNFRLDGSGVALPGTQANPRNYIFMAGITPMDLSTQTRVPGEGEVLTEPVENQVHFTAAIDYPPYQLHRDLVQLVDFYDSSSGVQLLELATGRVLVIPEPTATLLLGAGITLLCLRRRRR